MFFQFILLQKEKEKIKIKRFGTEYQRARGTLCQCELIFPMVLTTYVKVQIWTQIVVNTDLGGIRVLTNKPVARKLHRTLCRGILRTRNIVAAALSMED